MSETGGKAFPGRIWRDDKLNEGMDLRDYFAARAMQRLRLDLGLKEAYQTLAVEAYAIADAMLAERGRK